MFLSKLLTKLNKLVPVFSQSLESGDVMFCFLLEEPLSFPNLPDHDLLGIFELQLYRRNVPDKIQKAEFVLEVDSYNLIMRLKK